MRYAKGLNERLSTRVNDSLIPEYRQSKSEIVEWAKDTYGNNWASRLAAQLSGQTSGKAYKNARRNFEGNRAERDSKTPKWKAFGKQLPPLRKRAPKNGFQVHFRGRVKISGGRKSKNKRTGKYDGAMRGDGWAKADFTTTIPGGSEAIQFAHNPNWNAIFEPYFNNFDENPVTDFEIASLTIEAMD